MKTIFTIFTIGLLVGIYQANMPELLITISLVGLTGIIIAFILNIIVERIRAMEKTITLLLEGSKN